MVKQYICLVALISLIALLGCSKDDPTPAPTATAEPVTPVSTPTPADAADSDPSTTTEAGQAIAILREAAGSLSAETETCLADLLRDDPAIAQQVVGTGELTGGAMLRLTACLTPEEAAALTPPGEGPPPDVAGLACLTEELEGAPEKERILAVLSGADPSGEGLTLEESAALGEAVEACGLDTGFSFPGGEGNPLAETEWRLVELGRADGPDAAVGGADVQFSGTEIGGWTGCNGYGGGYSVQGDELRLIDVAVTERGCPTQELSRQEQRVLESLRTLERFEVSGERLTLHSEGGQVLVFERVER